MKDKSARICFNIFGDFVITLYDVCSVHRGDNHEYIGGCSVHRRNTMNTLGMFSTSEGYHEYIGGGGYHDTCGGDTMSTSGDTMVHRGNIMSTSRDVQYIGGIP